MARFTLILVAFAASLALGFSIPYYIPYISLSPHGNGIVMLPDGTTAAGAFDGSVYGQGALAAAAADYYSGAGVAVAAGDSTNTATAGATSGSAGAVGTNSRR